MPILVKDFSWEETESTVFIDVPLKGVASNKVDIFSAGQYLKVSFPPYMFEVYLKEKINESTSKATIADGLAKFKFEKSVCELWNSLQAAEVEDKKFMAAARQKAVEDSHKKAEELAEKKAKEKREQERFALREQMKKDEEEKRKIEEAKENIRKNAAESLEKWKKEQNKTENHSTNHSGAMFSHDDDVHADDEDDEHHKSQNGKKKMPLKDESPKKFSKKVKKKKDVPPPRSAGTIQVTFSHRPFKTPSRESKAPEEEEWLAKMAAAGRTTKTDNSDAVDMEEMNPLWLKDKGSSFYKNGNFVAAINAFTAAIVLDGSIPSIFSNRAACHLQMKQYSECIQDCCSALELLTPPVQANALSRCKALVRRGTAQAQIENYVQALVDYEAAIKLDPKNTKLQENADKLRQIIQGSK